MDFLNKLKEYITDAQKNRSQEMKALVSPKELRRDIKKENPNIPETDRQDIASNVKEDAVDYMSGVGMASPAVNLIGKAEESLGRLANKAPGLVNKIIQNIREPAVQQRNINLTNKASENADKISAMNRLMDTKAINPAPELDEVTKMRLRKNVDSAMDNLLMERELENLKKKSIQAGDADVPTFDLLKAKLNGQ